MMRPMKLAGDQLMYGDGCLAFLKDVDTKRAMIVTGGSSMKKFGIIDKVQAYLKEGGAETAVFEGVEPDPSFATTLRGAQAMKEFGPDLIVAVGGGSAMDAAKAMWVYYEHPELTTLEEVLTANPFPKLRDKARLCCIPSTAGTASEVSRSFVISDDDGIKRGLGNMEMMPDVVICDPQVTVSMPPHITAETGMDAMTHALEALVSNRANYISDIFVRKAIMDIHEYLPKAFEDGGNIEAREAMLNASMIAGMAFTNVSLGIVHSMAHAVGGLFHAAHGLADAIILPYIIEFNSADKRTKELYESVAEHFSSKNMADVVRGLNAKLNIPGSLGAIVEDAGAYQAKIGEMAQLAKADGCTKTNPIIPEIPQFEDLFKRVY